LNEAILKQASLSDVCLLVTDGTHDTPKTVPEGIPFIKAKEIVGGTIDFENCEYVTYEDHLKIVSRSKPEIGDTLFAHIGASLGEAAYIKTDKEFSIKNVALFKPDPKKINNRYLYYSVIGPKFQNEIKNTRTGSAQPFVSLGILRNHIVEYHKDLETQRKIASILSAYDDLIENNTRRIKNLEEMARMIYREWFVNFHFPGHEQVKMVDSPLGLIPEGWEVKAVQDTFEILGGGTPSTKEQVYWDGGSVNWYSPTDLTSKGTIFMDESGTMITELGLKKSSARLFPAFSVMMTSRATLGVIAINATEACTNQGFITCITNERFPLYVLYFWLRENVGQFISLASGATFKEITKGVFKTIELVVPPTELVGKFEEFLGTIGKQLLNLQRKNQNLRQTRDLLLPKLISGEVAVSDVGVNSESAL
jgi:type I restriction enzyme S subunit